MFRRSVLLGVCLFFLLGGFVREVQTAEEEEAPVEMELDMMAGTCPKMGDAFSHCDFIGWCGSGGGCLWCFDCGSRTCCY